MSWVCSGCLSVMDNHDCQCDSSVYGTTDEDVLCENCSNLEDMLIDIHGTNDLPETKNSYKDNRKARCQLLKIQRQTRFFA